VPGSLVGEDSMIELADFLPKISLGEAEPFSSLAIAIAVCLGLVGTLLNVRDWYVARQRLMTECPHRWIYVSAWYEGHYWSRHCRDCPKREIVALEDVPEEWRQRECAAYNARASARRDVWREGASVAPRLSRLVHRRSRSAR
jgi:hypothetical protein